MRLIDADYLKENMVRECRNIGEATGVTMPVLAITHVIDNAPTVEIVITENTRYGLPNMRGDV